jgi:hypothetical protein
MTHAFEHATEADRQLDLLAETMPYAEARRLLGLRDDEPVNLANWKALPDARDLLDRPPVQKGPGRIAAMAMKEAIAAGDIERIAELLQEIPKPLEDLDGKVA